MGGYIKDMVTLLKFVAPLVGPWINLSGAEYAARVAKDIQLMQELVNLMPEIVESDEMRLADGMEHRREPAEDVFVEGAGLRAVRLLLEKLDAQQVWGGLQRILTPEGHYLWLCEYHARDYKRY